MKLPKNIPKPDISDALTLLGSVSLAIGLWMIYPPAMFIVIGCGLIWLGLPGKVVK